ncbi:hypothetical protein NUW58_g1686 [Xylaria curta]|uniref:Uncharacterized protein n=1 Tax=Xylaria curta TaxID=42375 RepID=A0ACC1PJ68_9PEZI|nr:hypothetical protein NUW58_g1686 [Xylaria curta]
MSFTKTYFLCPASDFIHPPPAGPLCLGSIIRSTSTPHLPLNRASVVPITNAYPPVVETDWKKTVSAETGFRLGVYAQFLQLATGGLGLGAKVDVEHSSRTVNAFAFDTVTTVLFEPTPQQRFAPVVLLFFVTGMKLVKGAKVEYSTSGTTLISGNIGIDTSFSQDSEFVFAFRVKRLKFGRKVRTEEYSNGAFLAIGTDETDGGAETVLVDNVDGSSIENARLVPDATKNGNVYCIPA